MGVGSKRAATVVGWLGDRVSSKGQQQLCSFEITPLPSLRASSPIWASLARMRERGAPRGFAARSRVLARLASLAQIGDRRACSQAILFPRVAPVQETTPVVGYRLAPT